MSIKDFVNIQAAVLAMQAQIDELNFKLSARIDELQYVLQNSRNNDDAVDDDVAPITVRKSNGKK